MELLMWFRDKPKCSGPKGSLVMSTASLVLKCRTCGENRPDSPVRSIEISTTVMEVLSNTAVYVRNSLGLLCVLYARDVPEMKRIEPSISDRRSLNAGEVIQLFCNCIGLYRRALGANEPSMTLSIAVASKCPKSET